MGRADEHAALGERPHFRGVRRQRLGCSVTVSGSKSACFLSTHHSRALPQYTIGAVFDGPKSCRTGAAVGGGEGGHVFPQGLALW